MSLELDFFIKNIYIDINDSWWEQIEWADRLLMINKLNKFEIDGKKVRARRLIIQPKNWINNNKPLYDIKFKNNPFSENSKNWYYKEGDYGVIVLKTIDWDKVKVKALMLDLLDL